MFTGICQVTMLNETNTAALLKETHVNMNESKKILSAQEIRPFTHSWFPLIWGHINKYGNLEHFQGLPLIPLGTGNNITEIAVLQKESVLMYSEKDEDDDVISLLRQLGCTIVKKLPSYVLQNSSVFKCTYIYEYVDQNLMQLLSNLASELKKKEIVRKFAAIKNNAGKLELFRRVSNCHVGRDMHALLKSLPFIRNTNGTRLVSVEECQLIAPKELPSVMPQQMLLKIEHEVQVSFIEKLGGRQLSKREFIEQILLPEINKSTVPHLSNHSMIDYILDSIAISVDKKQWQTVINVLSSVRFLKSDDGQLHKPIELFRRCERLEKLFVGEEGRFPNMWQNVEVLKLKNESDVSADDIKRCLEKISGMKDEALDKPKKAKCILEHLERHKDLLQNESLINKMEDTAWIPINEKRPDVYPDCLTWYGENGMCSFGKPAEMATKENSNLVGSVRAVIPSHIEDLIAIKLVIKSRQLNHQDVINQLIHTIDKYDRKYRSKLMIVLNEIYCYLQTKYNELTADQVSLLKSMNWVLCDNCFVKPQQVVLKEYEHDMRPYIYNLPEDLPEINSLLLSCGSVASIDKEQLISVLEAINQEHEHQTRSREDVDQDKETCVKILQALGHMTLSDDDLNRTLVPIRCGDTELMFKISTQTVYSSLGGFNCEEEYIGSSEGEEDLLFLHECITEDIAKALRIRSLTSKLIGAEDVGLFEEYGQHEPLTRRINRILTDYGDGLAIVKELIQNADDAGAVEVKFLYDERLNEDKQRYLIDPGMKGVQGPALWAYNDAKFSKEDFENIVKLSGATKEDKRDKIGKFGLGFNAVYNITDVPSFISDNQLVILDPHTRHLGHAIKNKSKPGVKIPLGPRRNHLRRFEDQIRIYDGVFGMDASLSDGYRMFEGTLFRFPLRTERQAQVSEIKKLFYNKDEMKALIKKFSDEANRILLFTQNVRSVEFFYLEKDSKNTENIRNIFHVSKKMFYPIFDNKHLKTNVCESFDIMKQSSLAVESKQQNHRQDFVRNFWHVVDIVTIVKEDSKNLFEAESKYDNETWAIHSSIDDKECMSMALKSSQLNPVASVAVCIEESRDGKTYRLLQQQPSNSGYFYCFLPLPMPNGLNVDINSTFALSKDRKSFQERSEDDKTHDTLYTIWNRKLMSGPVSSAYIELLKDLTSLIDLEDEVTWYNLWPLKDAIGSNMRSYKQELNRSFYHNILREREHIFPKPKTRNQWLNWTQIMTIDGSIKHMTNGGAIEEAMEEVVKSVHKEKVVVHLPQELLSTLEEAGFKKELTMIVLSFSRFFSQIFMPNVKELPSHIREIILLFAMHNYSHDSLVRNSIKECECIPTQPNHRLRKPSNLVKPMSKAADLFELDEEMFPLSSFEDCYGKLMELGMLSDVISWGLLICRAKTVNTLGVSMSKVAEARARKILQLIQEKMAQKIDSASDLSWEYIEFLPVKQKPSNWLLLDWEGTKSDKQFASANKMYPNRFEKLIGCHKLIIDNDITGYISPAVEKLLGVRTKFTVNDIIFQVAIISEHIKDKEKGDLPTVLPSLFTRIYRSLSDAISMDANLVPQIVEGFRGKAVILTKNNTLVKSEKVAFNPTCTAEPYLYKLQNELAVSHRRIMTALGVKESFSMEQYNSALKAMEKDVGGNPLSDSQLNTVRELLESMDKESISKPRDIFLPAKDKVLWQKKFVIVKESLWLKNDPSKRYLHDCIPPRLALSLGAKTERSQSIVSQSRGLPFGQHEKLTVRLKRILEAYPSQIQILYELLQNADDAGASEVKFILDKRQHPTKMVFGDAWRSLQGPALLVFNDAPFTHRDIEGIQNLGEGSKSDDCQKTGQYGIGFNVVYHVTDAPCLLTKVDDKSVLCIFDPHARFLEECSDAKPGRMFNNGREYLKDTFPDIYNTFLPEFLTNEESAILRLPLRSQWDSSIKQKPTTIKEVSDMFDIFRDKGSEAIIFLRNVKSVELFIIEDNILSDKPRCVFSVHTDMTHENREALSLFNEDFKSQSSSIRDHSRSESAWKYKAIQWELTLRTGKEKRKDYDVTWRIIQKCASINPKDLPSSLDKQYKDGKLPLIPVGGIAHKIDGAPIDSKVYCLLPLAVPSSLPLHINGKFILDYESRKRLWYTIEDSFQKTWNYYVIEHCVVPCYVQLLRTLAHEKNFVLCKTDLFELLQGPCMTTENVSFDNLSPFKLLGEMFRRGDVHPKEIEAYFRNFPKLRENERAHEYDVDLIKMFYKRITNDEVNVMPVLRPSSKALRVEFCPPNSMMKQFYYIDYFEHKKFIGSKLSKVCITLIKVGMNIYNIPPDIVQSFRESDVPLKNLTPEVVSEFLRNNSDIIMKNQEQLELKSSVFFDVHTVEALLHYCVEVENFSLNGLPLLVTEDEVLRRFDDSKNSKVIYYGEVSILFPSRKHMSLHPKLRSTLSKFSDKQCGALRKFMLDDFSRLMNEELDAVFKRNDEIEIQDIEMLNSTLPIKNWLRHAWTFLRQRFKEWELKYIEEENERVEKIKNQVLLGSNKKHRTPKEMGITPKKFLDPISRWCLLPVERQITKGDCSKQYYLIRIENAPNAVRFGGRLRDITHELGLPVPSPLFVENMEIHQYSSLNTNLLIDMVTDPEDVNAFIDVLVVERKRENTGFNGLSPGTGTEFLRYLSKKAKCIDDIRRGSLKELPIWEDISGKLKAISSAADCYLIDDGMPENGISFLQDCHNALLLKRHPSLEHIYDLVGLETQSDTDVYCNLILIHFAELQPDDRFAHLLNLKKKFFTLDGLETDLSEKLKNTKIIEKNGELSYARDFYDPEEKLLTLMLTESNFPPEKYRNSNWLSFLKSLGLVSIVSPDLFCSFASGISKIQEKEERLLKSKALIEHFWKSDELRGSLDFLHRLSLIPFLVQEKIDNKLCEIFPGRNNEGLLCFNGAVVSSERNIMLSWTVEHILPSYATRYMLLKEFHFNELSALQNVTCHIVASNLKNIAKSHLLENVAMGVTRYPHNRMFKRTYDFSYEFLSNERIDQGTISMLCKIPMILVNDNMISIGNKVTMEKEFTIPPFLFSMPSSLGKFENLFKEIGMSEKPTIMQLTQVLCSLFVRSNGNSLDPNEAKTCLKVILRIMDEIVEKEFPSDITLLPLPGCRPDSSTVCLHESQHLVYFDYAHLEERLTNFKLPRFSLEFMAEQTSRKEGKATRDAIFQFITKLPPALRPKNLSSIVKEVMIDSATIPNFGFTEDLHNVMKCFEFADCMIRLLNHQNYKCLDSGIIDTQNIFQLLSRVEVITKQTVETVLVFQEDEVRVEDSECRKDVFVAKEECLRIYISSSLSNKLDTLIAVAGELVSLFGSHFTNTKVSLHVVALLGKNPKDMHKYLDEQNILRNTEGICDNGGLYYSPGEHVPLDLHCLLVNKVTKFDVDAYVAYEVEDPGLDGKDGHPVYIYGRILECITKNAINDFYKIDIGMEEPIVVHKSELYGFCRLGGLQEDNEDEHFSIEEAKESIKKELGEAFKQGEEYAKRIIKRLWLKWHPDKNMRNEEFCTEVFKFIQAEVARSRGDSKDGFWNYEEAFERYSQRGRSFNEQKNHFHEMGYSWSNGYWRAPNGSKNPQPGQARRWLRQASFDLKAAKGDPTQGCYEWVCFKCHQVSSQYFA